MKDYCVGYCGSGGGIEKGRYREREGSVLILDFRRDSI